MEMTECVPSVAKKATHREWRKLAKKLRRKRIRQKKAEVRETARRAKETSPTFLTNLAKEKLLHEYEMEIEERERNERHVKWLLDEEEAQKKFKEQERLKLLAQEEKLREQERIREEFEKQQAKLLKLKEEQEKERLEEEKRRQETMERINDFIENGGPIPLELEVDKESKPGKEPCPFFTKVGACRFGNQCSRNHSYPGISNTILIVNFYSHFKLEHSRNSEYDTDIHLEYEDSDMFLHFKEFYNDVVPELKAHGAVTMVKVCCNTEFHLRGNLYVEYKTKREALIAYKTFQGRWYGGKQLNVEFVTIKDWTAAICGDFSRRKCPKGNACNFLHVFRNPRNEYPVDWFRNRSNRSSHSARADSSRGSESHARHWRWSESPEHSSRHESRARKSSSRESRNGWSGSHKRHEDRSRRKSSRDESHSRSSSNSSNSLDRKKKKH